MIVASENSESPIGRIESLKVPVSFDGADAKAKSECSSAAEMDDEDEVRDDCGCCLSACLMLQI